MMLTPLKRTEFTLCTIAYNEPVFMRRWLDHYYDKVDQIVIVYGRVDKYKRVDDHITLNTILTYPDPAKKIMTVRRPTWVDKIEMQNIWLTCAKHDIIVFCGVDEFIEDIRSVVQAFDERQLVAACLSFQHYWKDTNYLLQGGRFDKKLMRVIRKLPGARFEGHLDNYLVDGQIRYHSRNTPSLDFLVHHYGYTKSLDQLRRKHEFYCARGDGIHTDHPSWFENDWPAGLGKDVVVVPFSPRHNRQAMRF